MEEQIASLVDFVDHDYVTIFHRAVQNIRQTLVKILIASKFSLEISD